MFAQLLTVQLSAEAVVERAELKKLGRNGAARVFGGFRRWQSEVRRHRRHRRAGESKLCVDVALTRRQPKQVRGTVQVARHTDAAGVTRAELVLRRRVTLIDDDVEQDVQIASNHEGCALAELMCVAPNLGRATGHLVVPLLRRRRAELVHECVQRHELVCIISRL